jgi:hypothetical protein
MALLEYLHCDHAEIEAGDSVGILVLANQYNACCLVSLCELYTTKQVDRMVEARIERAEVDVIGLLLCAEVSTLSCHRERAEVDVIGLLLCAEVSTLSCHRERAEVDVIGLLLCAEVSTLSCHRERAEVDVIGLLLCAEVSTLSCHREREQKWTSLVCCSVLR